MTAFWRKIVVYLGYCLAGLIILAALLVSVTRMLTPLIDQHHADFEKIASQMLGRRVHIEQVRIRWNVLEPELTFDQVTVFRPQDDKPVLQIPRIKMNLAIVSSLLHWQPMLESVSVAGVRLTLRQLASGDVQVEGFQEFTLTDNVTGHDLNTNAVFEWIFSQPHLILQHSDITVVLKNGEKKSITLYRLALHNTATQHELAGAGVLNQNIPMRADVRVQWEGSVADLSHVSANLYLYLEGIALPQWFSRFAWHNLKVLQGIGSAKIWAEWQNNDWQKIQSAFQFYDLTVQSLATKKTASISRLSGNVGWKREGKNQVIAGDDLLIDLPRHLWPATSFTIQYAPTADGIALQQLHIGYLDISDVAVIVQNSGFLPDAYRPYISALNPQGEIRDFQVTLPNGSFADLSHVTLAGKFINLSMNAWNNVPGINNLRGELGWDGTQGKIAFDSEAAVLTFKHIFTEPLQLDSLTGDVLWSKDKTGTWILTAKDLQAKNADITTQTNATLTIPAKDSPSINLLGNFTVADVAHVSRYLPTQIFDRDLVGWLQAAFLSGQLDSGNAVLQGKLSDFPFDHGKGKFAISGVANGITLHYAPQWPDMHDLTGKLLFSGRSMLIDLNGGRIADVPIKTIHAEIPYLGEEHPQILTVQGLIDADLAEGLQFIQNSPLQATLGKDLAALQMQGPMQLKLGLVVPLGDLDHIKVTGDTTMLRATLSVPEWNLALTELNGAFNFTDSSLSATHITGQLFAEPVVLSLMTKAGDITAELNGKLSIGALQKWLNVPLAPLVQGTTNYKAALQLVSQPKPTRVVITSDLIGVTLALPAPYGKTATEAKKFQLLLNVQQNQPLKTKLTYNNVFAAAVAIQKDPQRFRLLGGEIHLGAGDADWQTQPGLLLTANMDKLDWDMIAPYYAQFSAKSASSSALSSFITPDMIRGADISVKKANLFGLQLNNLDIEARKKLNGLQIALTNPVMVGQILLPDDTDEMIQAKFQRLYLPSQTMTGKPIDPGTLPAFSFEGNDVRYGDKNFGHVVLYVIPGQRGVVIKQLNADSAVLKLRANGTWQAGRSHLRGELSSTQVSQFLESWGFASTNLVGGKGEADFDLSWPGAPYDPSLANISGNLSLKLGAGRIVNLGDSTDAQMGLGRLLNIFSLQTLPRRLSLDFSDLFEKGYSFDSLKGDFVFKNGSATTGNTRFDGPVARIDISGRIGIAAKDLDMRIGVTPNVTASLPVVATLAGGPLAGLATWVVDTVVSHAVSKITTHSYVVTGSWANPVWQKVGAQPGRPR